MKEAGKEKREEGGKKEKKKHNQRPHAQAGTKGGRKPREQSRTELLILQNGQESK